MSTAFETLADVPDDVHEPDIAEIEEHDESELAIRLRRARDDSFDPAMLEKALQIRGVVHPDDVVTQLRYAPLALAHLCWRNTVVEDWHADPDSPLHDGEMMAANVATTRIFHQVLWDAFGERIADATLVSRYDFTPDDVVILRYAFADAYEAGFHPDRLLPHGQTLREIGGDELDVLTQHADVQLDALLDQAERRGVATVILWLAARGSAGCAGWWGSPRWPRIVEAFLARLADRNNDYWERWGWVDPPAEAQDVDRFRHLLLSAPDELEPATLQFCIDQAGIGFIRLDD